MPELPWFARWQLLEDAAQAELRWLAMKQLRRLDWLDAAGMGNLCGWAQCHRELLELKAACGYGQGEHYEV